MRSVTSYLDLVDRLKQEIKTARLKAVLSANVHLLQLYWRIGQLILSQQAQEGWGAKVIDRLANDLRKEFPEMKGISARNLKYMRAFAEAWPQFVQEALAQNAQAAMPSDRGTIVQDALAQITWYHHITILDKIKDVQERLFYIRKTVEGSWSRNVLVHQTELQLYTRQGKLQHNFAHTLPAHQSDLARELFKDPYKFDFLQLSTQAQERDVEHALVEHITKFLLEMGKGFAYVGRQVQLEKGAQDYFIDLLFNHVKLHCYVVIELKIGDFKPEYAGKMNFYFSAVDEDLKTPEDKPSIGLILCKSKNKVTVEYALRDINKPMEVAGYEITESIPMDLKGELPTIEALEHELEKEIQLPEKPLHQKLKRLKDLVSTVEKEEEVEKLRDKAAILELYNRVLLETKALVQESLAEVTPLFLEHVLEVSINRATKGGLSLAEIEAIIQREDIYELGLNLRLEVFIKAGTQAFSLYKRLTFSLAQYKYQIGSEREVIWLEKLHHQPWTKEELAGIAEKWCEEIVEEITTYLEREQQ